MFTMITKTAHLLELVAQAKSAEAIALDTEFFWERTYYPRLGLIQLAVSGDECHLIDPLAVGDLRPLGALLANRGVVKIFHDAAQDLAILYRATGVAAHNVFDTRLAAGFASLPSTLSLAALIRELLDIDLAKTETRSDWLRRPLSAEQLEYAKDDVRYLHALRLLLLNRIIGPKVKAWLQEDLALYNNPHCYISDGSGRYQRLRGASTLPPSGAAILRRLFDWREETARADDKPRGHIIPDAGLLAIAHQPPADIPALRDLGLSSQAISRYGGAIITLCTETLAAPEKVATATEKTWRLSATEKEMLGRLQEMIRLKSDILGIDPVLIGNSDELRAVARFLAEGASPPEHLRPLSGWRMTFLEDFFHHNG
ncbi:MAG: ribonuclease D [Desulfobulbaceae bacterium]|jgi:ribonuclease D|nr:ribonuclease D [Desulfobulbaceae bacterium]